MFIKVVYLDCILQLLLSILNILCVEANPKSLSTALFLFLTQQPPQWARVSSFTKCLDHTQLRTTVGRTPLDE